MWGGMQVQVHLSGKSSIFVRNMTAGSVIHHSYALLHSFYLNLFFHYFFHLKFIQAQQAEASHKKAKQASVILSLGSYFSQEHHLPELPTLQVGRGGQERCHLFLNFEMLGLLVLPSVK